MRPTARLAGAFVLSQVLQLYAATSAVPWLLLLSTWIIALIAAAAGYSAWNRGGLRLSLAARGSRAAAGSPLEELPEQLLQTAPLPAAIFEGDALDLDFGLNTVLGALGPATVTGSVGGQQISFGTGVVPRSGWRRTIEIPSLRRGSLGAASWEIKTSDFFGFFRGRKRCPDVEVALVMPRFTSLRDRRIARELEASVAAPRAGSGNELFGVREYRAGDSLRRIHWRSSARHGELVVREYEPPGVRMLALIVDPAPSSVEIADQIARIAASETWDCIRDGGRVVLWAPGLAPTEPSQSRSLWDLLAWLARYPKIAASEETLRLRGEEVVVVTAGDARTADEAEVAAGRGARVRGWVVGDADVNFEFPLHRVGVAWPL